MSAFFAVIARDLKLSLRLGGDVLTLLLFFLSIGVVVPFAVGPDRVLLAAIAPAMIWVAALLAQLLSHDRLFRSDFEDGSLIAFRHGSLSLEAIVFAKLVAHWLLSGLPLIVAAPALGLLFGMDGAMLGAALLGLLLGTPALAAFVALSAAVTVGLKRGGLVAPVLILPLTLPVLIFGAGTMSRSAMGASGQAMLFLAALSLLTVALVPFAAALALRISGE
ncbi:heme exporter protein CcmB [Pelagibacterium xiamenense]|uniref:heme exporter protein CcmB n=1 Tax=Pelagibacterium xiamenense TaxID=2901140 RepID=UPI001E29ABB7|nr:heme exporter protein CcmB [Pelagibacterium xiamenense]MCD7058394.1 heme exporter protein CcmB [Pelagibacterium xiamenense]